MPRLQSHQTESRLKHAHPPLVSKEQEHDDRQARSKTARDAGHSILEREKLTAGAQEK